METDETPPLLCFLEKVSLMPCVGVCAEEEGEDDVTSSNMCKQENRAKAGHL